MCCTQIEVIRADNNYVSCTFDVHPLLPVSWTGLLRRRYICNTHTHVHSSTAAAAAALVTRRYIRISIAVPTHVISLSLSSLLAVQPLFRDNQAELL